MLDTEGYACIIAEARKTPSVDALYNDVLTKSRITFESGCPGQRWGSKTVDGESTSLNLAGAFQQWMIVIHDLND